MLNYLHNIKILFCSYNRSRGKVMGTKPKRQQHQWMVYLRFARTLEKTFKFPTGSHDMSQWPLPVSLRCYLGLDSKWWSSCKTMADRLVQMTTTLLMGSEQCKLRERLPLFSLATRNSCSKNRWAAFLCRSRLPGFGLLFLSIAEWWYNQYKSFGTLDWAFISRALMHILTMSWTNSPYNSARCPAPLNKLNWIYRFTCKRFTGEKMLYVPMQWSRIRRNTYFAGLDKIWVGGVRIMGMHVRYLSGTLRIEISQGQRSLSFSVFLFEV